MQKFDPVEIRQRAFLALKIEGIAVCEIYCENTTALGIFHDALMMAKGYVVDRMVAAHKEEQAAAEQMQKQYTEHE